MPLVESSQAPEWALLSRALAMVAVLVGALAALFLAKRVGLRAVEFLVRRTTVQWDDVLYERGVFSALAWLAPALVIYYSAYLFSPAPQGIVQRLLFAYMQTILVITLVRLVNAASVLYGRTPYAQTVTIKGYVQVINLVVVLFGAIIIFATLVNQSPWGLLSGLGALTAVLVLVFRDTILSFVASIQIATNDMVRVGDWITFPKYDADGDVIDIALHTVKVQNFDKTISNIPTQRFIDEGFKNWRGMRQSGGRRIKRAIYVDATSIRFLDGPLKHRLSQVALLHDYFAQPQLETEVDDGADPSHRLDHRRRTNIGTFRAYATAYLKAHPQIHQDRLTFLVRQLAPGPNGVGIEIYVFSKDQRWAAYEEIQADIIDHLLASIGDFDLRVFQHPTGRDLRGLKEPVGA